MICPMCGANNDNILKSCASCGYPLTMTQPATEVKYVPPPPKLSAMSVWSLVLSFFALIPPATMVGLVLGHVALKKIGSSGGRLTGKRIAWAGLVIGYLHLGLVAGLLMVGLNPWVLFLRGTERTSEAAWNTADYMAFGRTFKAPARPTADELQQQQAHALAALKIIADEQQQRIKSAGGKPACGLQELGYGTKDDHGLSAQVDGSKYWFMVNCPPNGSYSVLAVPQYEELITTPVVYCMDQTATIKKIAGAAPSNCFTLGQPVNP